jgi:hypothetical protein
VGKKQDDSLKAVITITKAYTEWQKIMLNQVKFLYQVTNHIFSFSICLIILSTSNKEK